MNYWFSSDPHFDHKGIIRLSNRPFDNVDEMNEVIIDNYNKHIKSDDIFYLLGDFGFCDSNRLLELRKQINCKNIHFAMGNHDKLGAWVYNKAFCHVFIRKKIKIEDKSIILDHFPILEWDGYHKKSWHLYGHVHGNITHPAKRAYDVGVDVNNYKPISFEELNDKIK